MLLFLAAAAKSKGSSSASFFLIIIVAYAAIYFLFLRPRMRKQKAARSQSRQVEVGERAQTIGGFVGTVISREDGLVTLQSADGAKLDFIPSAIARRFDPVVPESTDDDATADAPEDEAPEGDK